LKHKVILAGSLRSKKSVTFWYVQV